MPANFLQVVNRQPQLAALAAGIGVDALLETMRVEQEAGRDAIPCLVAMPSVLLHPDAGELALPNLIVPLLGLSAAARTVLLFEDIPSGAGQALRMLIDRGLHVAVTAAAAAGADSVDLAGWSRWGIIFPEHVLAPTNGVDALIIQQTATAIGTPTTRLIGVVGQSFDQQAVAHSSITAVVDLTGVPGRPRT